MVNPSPEKKPRKGTRGGARPGAGRKPKVAKDVATSTVMRTPRAEKPKSKRGGARPGAGRKPKVAKDVATSTVTRTPRAEKPKSKRGGARPGAGRKPKVAKDVATSTVTRTQRGEKPKSKRGGARPGAGRKPKVAKALATPTVTRTTRSEKPKSKRGGARPGAGRKPKVKVIASEQTIPRVVLAMQALPRQEKETPLERQKVRQVLPTQEVLSQRTSTPQKATSKRGGPRPGAGRKPLPNARRRVFSIRLNDQRKEFCQRKGQKYFQNLIEELMQPEHSKDEIQEVRMPSMRPSQKANIPFVRMDVPCGFPSPALDYESDEINLHDYLIHRPEATILIRAEGESMTAAGINDGDLLIVDRSVTPRNNDIVLAYFDGQFTIKRFYKTDDKTIRLRPDSFKPDYPVIHPNLNDFQIEGVVTGITRKLK